MLTTFIVTGIGVAWWGGMLLYGHLHGKHHPEEYRNYRNPISGEDSWGPF